MRILCPGVVIITGLTLGLSCDRDESPPDSLGRAIEQNNVEVVDKLPIGAASLDAADGSWPPLAKAIAQGQAEVARVLIARGADPNLAGEAGQTPLMLVWRIPGTAVIEDLFKAGADLNKVDSRGMTALMTATSSGRADIAKLLISAGADINLKDHEGRTALIWASTSAPDASVITQLLAKDTDPNARDKQESTPLMHAAAGGHVAVIKALIAGGAEMEARDYRGETAVFYAVGLNKPKALETLIAAGADMRAIRNDGSPLVALAMSPGREACLEILHKAGVEIPPANPAVRIGK